MNLHLLVESTNIAIGNSDDHFCNQGFLLTPRGWCLSPTYDMNPSMSEYQGLLINRSTNESSLDILLDSCEEYMIAPADANVIIDEVVKRVSQWRELALRLGISKGEIDYFSQKFTRILSHTDFNG